MNRRIAKILEELRTRFEERYGDRLVQMILFGSQARGDAVAGSDIDVLVVLQGPVDPAAEVARTGDIASDLSLEHEVVISCLFLDEECFCKGGGPLLRNVAREGVPI